MKKWSIILFTLTIICHSAFAQSPSFMQKGFMSGGVMAYRIAQEVKKDPDVAMEASMITSAAMAGIVDYVTRDIDSDQYKGAENLPCPIFGNYFYKNSDESFRRRCLEKQTPAADCERIVNTIHHMKELSCRITDKGIIFKGISKPVDEALERIMAGQTISYTHGMFFFNDMETILSEDPEGSTNSYFNNTNYPEDENGKPLPLTQVSNNTYEYTAKNGIKSIFEKKDNKFVRETVYKDGKKKAVYTLKYGRYRSGPAEFFDDEGRLYAKAEYVMESIRYDNIGFPNKIICLNYTENNKEPIETEIPKEKMSKALFAEELDCDILTSDFSITLRGKSVPLKKMGDHLYGYQYPNGSWRVEFIEKDGKLIKQIYYLNGIKTWEYTLLKGDKNGPAIAYYEDNSGEILAELSFEKGKLISGRCPYYNSKREITKYTPLSQRAINHFNEKNQLNCDL